jgi:hypothetical protein
LIVFGQVQRLEVIAAEHTIGAVLSSRGDRGDDVTFGPDDFQRSTAANRDQQIARGIESDAVWIIIGKLTEDFRRPFGVEANAKRANLELLDSVIIVA